VKAPEVTDDTLADYKKRLGRVKPYVGHHKLGKLTSAEVQELGVKLAGLYPNSKKTVS
jgi:hypothetical protein